MSAVQQIDLFHPSLRPKRVPLQFRDLKLGAVLALGACFLGGALRYHEVSQLEAKRGEAERRVTVLTTAGEQLRARVDGAELLALKEEVARLAAVERAQQELLGLLHEGAQRNRQVLFSEQLQALARRAVDGVWLTRIKLDAAARTVALYGRAQQPVLVPELLQSLAGTSAYEGYVFDRLEIAETEEGDHRFAVVGPSAATE
ncbi:MAG: PilN domain-containing protein [Pseudomonadota bacterium]